MPLGHQVTPRKGQTKPGLEAWTWQPHGVDLSAHTETPRKRQAPSPHHDISSLWHTYWLRGRLYLLSKFLKP